MKRKEKINCLYWFAYKEEKKKRLLGTNQVLLFGGNLGNFGHFIYLFIFGHSRGIMIILEIQGYGLNIAVIIIKYIYIYIYI